MGDINPPPTEPRPGIALVRPKLHDNTQENRDLFRRWSKLHMRDTLSIPNDEIMGGASRVLRYTRATEEGGEEYLFTILLDHVRLPGTEGFQKVPQRLDLENTRALGDGEEPVLPEGDPCIGTEPMVFSIVAPSVGIFEAVVDTNTTEHSHKSYQHELTELVTKADASKYTLVTITITITKEIPTPAFRIKRFCFSLACTLGDATHQLVHATLYRQAPDAQPDMLPKIPQGQDGRGEWIVCALVGGATEDKLVNDMGADWTREMLVEQVKDWRKGFEKEGALREVDMKVGVWKGDVFMS